MRLWQVRGKEYGLRRNMKVFAVGLGSYGPSQTCFLVPLKGQDREVDESAWGLQASFRGKPMLVANTDHTPGVVLFLTSFNRPGKQIGRLYVVDNGHLADVLSIGYGVGGTEDGSVYWEEGLVAVRGTATFYLSHVGPPDAIVTVNGEEVHYREVAAAELERWIEGDLVRLDDPRIPRWKPPVELES